MSSLSFISGIVGLNCIDIVLNTIAFGKSEQENQRLKILSFQRPYRLNKTFDINDHLFQQLNLRNRL
jgi:hypothetical protein